MQNRCHDRYLKHDRRSTCVSSIPFMHNTYTQRDSTPSGVVGVDLLGIVKNLIIFMYSMYTTNLAYIYHHAGVINGFKIIRVA